MTAAEGAVNEKGVYWAAESGTETETNVPETGEADTGRNEVIDERK